MMTKDKIHLPNVKITLKQFKMQELLKIDFHDVAPDWAHSHVQVPTPFILKNGNLRVYFATRNTAGKSLTTYFDIAKDFKILKYSKPILQLGEIGTFDRDGVMVSSIIEISNQIYLYYTGWSVSSEVPYTTSVGLAISKDNGSTFTRYSKGPILGIDQNNHLFTNTPYVSKINSSYRCFYGSGLNWIERNNKWEPQYQIKEATSSDGINWKTTENHVISTLLELESNVRPWLIKINEEYHLYYCFRGTNDFRNGTDSYNIAFAISKDLKSWSHPKVLHELQIFKEEELKMCAYPAVIEWNGRTLLFYNGNTFGKYSIYVIEI